MRYSGNDQRSKWNSICTIGGVAALSAVLVGLLEIVITFLPGGNLSLETVRDWFNLFHRNWFMGLRDMGLLNIFLDTLAIPIYLALYAAHRESPQAPYATLAVIVSFLGIGIFFATNQAFPMLALSHQYAAATNEAQRAVLEAAGQSLLAVGQSHTPGTFLGFVFTEMAGVLISIVMLRGRIFSGTAAYAGIFGFGFLLVFEVFSSFVAGLTAAAITLALLGGVLSMVWYILIAMRLFQLGKNPLGASQG
jgi:hypothetical protein